MKIFHTHKHTHTSAFAIEKIDKRKIELKIKVYLTL